MNKQALKTILLNGENNTIEFKKSFQKEVIETIVAFANAKGGKILLGVNDAGDIIGLELNKESLPTWVDQIKQNTSPSVIPDMHILKIDSKKLVVIEVKEYPIKPVSYKNRYLVRRSSANHVMSM